VLATVKTDAEGIRLLRNALDGEGGRNMVRFEYAKRLKQAIVRSTPIIRQGIETPQSIQRFKYIEDAPKIDYMFPEPPDAALVSPLKPVPDKSP
ncbi:MAG: hypothetical protein AAB331_01715, partial [Planctomycetota bacterium]